MNSAAFDDRSGDNVGGANASLKMGVLKFELTRHQVKLKQIGAGTNTQRTNFVLSSQDLCGGVCRLQNHVLQTHTQAEELGHDPWQGEPKWCVNGEPLQVGA